MYGVYVRIVNFGMNIEKHAMKNFYYSNTSYIKAKTSAIRNERLDFMEGKRLGDLSIRIEDNATVRKVRRIVEKRVSQNYYRKNPGVKWSAKYATRHHKSNILKNIYGMVPEGFRYCCA